MRTDGRTDGHDEDNSRFSQFWDAPKNRFYFQRIAKLLTNLITFYHMSKLKLFITWFQQTESYIKFSKVLHFYYSGFSLSYIYSVFRMTLTVFYRQHTISSHVTATRLQQHEVQHMAPLSTVLTDFNANNAETSITHLTAQDIQSNALCSYLCSPVSG